ncbi:MAG: hypothetical protein ABJH05_03210 [Fulvivirga sp.]
MKTYKRIIYIVLILAFTASSCEDEELLEKNNPTWETGVNGFGQFQDGSATNFIREDLSVDLSIDFHWLSVDGANEVVKEEFYINFTESYTNPDGDPAVADHGTVLLSTVDSPPANRENVSFSISQMDLLPFYNGATYDYDEDSDTPETPVFNNPDKPLRNTTTAPFIDGDSFTLSWVLTTADGRVFGASNGGDGWSPSVCTELPGSNCELTWIVECGQVIKEPAQDYTIVFNDSYGDGWNGAAIRVIVDGVSTDYTLDDGSTTTTVVTVPDGTQTLAFEYVSGDWDSEVTFTITTEKGNVIASAGPSPGAGPITLDLCSENE